MATVRLPRLLDATSGGRRSVTVEGEDVGTVVAGLLDEMPGLEVHLFDHTGALRTHVLCFVDGEPTRLVDRSQPVETEVRFLQSVSGGGAGGPAEHEPEGDDAHHGQDDPDHDVVGEKDR